MAEGDAQSNCFVRAGKVHQQSQEGVKTQSDDEREGDDTSPGSWPPSGPEKEDREQRQRPQRGRRSMAATGRGAGGGLAEDEDEEQEEDTPRRRGRVPAASQGQGLTAAHLGGGAAADAAAGTVQPPKAPPPPPTLPPPSAANQAAHLEEPPSPTRFTQPREALTPRYDMCTPQATPEQSPTPSPRRHVEVRCKRTPSPDNRASLGNSPQNTQGVVGQMRTPPIRLDKVTRRIAPIPNEDDREKTEFEWQFEIMNGLPRERAIALVEYIRRSEKERHEACSQASQLRRSNAELEQRLQELTKVKTPRTPPARQLSESGVATRLRRVRRCCCWCLWKGFFVLLVLSVGVLALAFAAAHNFELPPLPAEVQQFAGERWPAVYEGAGELGQMVQSRLGIDLRDVRDRVCAKGTVRETTVREMTVRETLHREYSPEEYERMQSEHAVMKSQFSSLQNDIDDALHRGQDMVCWRV